MSTTAPDIPPYQQPTYAQPPQGAWQQPQPSPQHHPAARPEHGSMLRRWPTWAQNTALIVGAVAVLVVVFFAGFFTGHATNDTRGGFGTNQNFDPRQFGGQGGQGGFGSQVGDGS